MAKEHLGGSCDSLHLSNAASGAPCRSDASGEHDVAAPLFGAPRCQIMPPRAVAPSSPPPSPPLAAVDATTALPASAGEGETGADAELREAHGGDSVGRPKTFIQKLRELGYAPRDLFLIYSIKFAESTAYFAFSYIYAPVRAAWSRRGRTHELPVCRHRAHSHPPAPSDPARRRRRRRRRRWCEAPWPSPCQRPGGARLCARARSA